MAIPIANTVECKLFAQRGGRLRLNVLHYRYNNPPPTSTELRNLNNDIVANIIDKYEDFVSIGTQWYQIVSTDIASSGGATDTLSTNRLSVGPIDDFPGNVSYVLTKRTAFTGRTARGRMYLIDLPEDFFNGDNFNPAYSAVVNNLAAKLLQFQVSGRFIPAVGSRSLGGSTPIQAITYDYISDTQRRRGKGHGI